MLTFWAIVTGATVFGGVPAVGGLWMFERWRSRRRNRRGDCATCGTAWSATPSGDPYLIHGRLVCESCAEKAKRRLPWQLAALGGFGAIATTGVFIGEGLALMVLFPAAVMVAMTFGAVQVMKFANRRAQRRIAMGEFPEIRALGSGEVVGGHP